MKKLCIVAIFACITATSLAQTKTIAPQKTKQQNIEIVLNQQTERLNARIDSMTIAHQQAIETVKNEQKEQYVNYYNQLDSNNSRAWVILSLIWGAISVVCGIAIPLVINHKAEERVNENIRDLKAQVNSDTNDLKRQLHISLQNNAKAQTSRHDLFAQILSKQIEEQSESFANRIKEQRDYIDGIKNEVSQYLTQSKIQGLLSKANNSLKKHPEQAIVFYTDILNIESTNEDALLWRGIAYCNSGKSDKALEDLYKLVKIHPRHARAYNNIGNVYSNEKQYELALKKYHMALEINPQYAAVYSNIAVLYSEQGEYQKALEYCDKALEIDDEIIKTHKQKINIYAKLAKSSENEETRQKYIDKIQQEQVVVNMLKDRYLSELMSL